MLRHKTITKKSADSIFTLTRRRVYDESSGTFPPELRNNKEQLAMITEKKSSSFVHEEAAGLIPPADDKTGKPTKPAWADDADQEGDELRASPPGLLKKLEKE